MTNYHTTIIIITLFALFVLSVLIMENNRLPQAKKRIFLVTSILIASAAIAEYVGIWIGGKKMIPKAVLAAVKVADYSLTPMTSGALIMLIQDSDEKSRTLRKVLIGNVIVQVISAFHGWMVVIDDQNYYTHGQLYPLYMAFYLGMIIVLMLELLEYGKSYRKQNRTSLYAAIILAFVGIVIQEVFDCRVAYLAATFAEIFLYIHYAEFGQLRLDEELNEQQIKLAYDPLTGVLSRFAYTDAMKMYEGKFPEHFVVFLIDINGLKVVNDSLGHEAGDELICAAAECITETIGKKGQTFRIGGDEFVVLTSMKREKIEEKLLELTRTTEKWSGEKVDKVSVSVGYAIAEEHKDLSIEELVKEADKGMYKQKEEYYRKNGLDRRKR